MTNNGPQDNDQDSPPAESPQIPGPSADGSSSADSLAAALAQHGIDLPDDRVALLDRYCRLLWDWNSKINLTRHTDYDKFVARDVVDSLAFADHLGESEKILDVGTGGGVPGIILAIVRPDLHVSLCDSVGKKARAVAEMVAELGLDVPVYPENVQAVLQAWRGDALVLRAVARLRKILTWLDPHWNAFHRLLLVKGPAWVEERGEARHHGQMNDLELRKLASYPLAGTDSESVLLQITRRGA